MSTVAERSDPRGLERRRAVALHADIADYSRHMADDEAATVATVRAYQEIVARAVGDAGGTMVNFVGDSFVAVFADAQAAMRTAIAICGTVSERNRHLPKTRHMWFRLGLDIGDIVVAEDGRHFGEVLNIAARVQAIADVGGINVTEAVFRELDEPGLRLIGIGARRLKNIPEPVRVYRLAGAAGDNDRPRQPDRPALQSVAVLPVIGIDNPKTREIAHGLRLDLVTALTNIPGLRVIDAAVAAGGPGLGVELGAAYVLESGVVRSGERLRAYAEIVETVTMNRVWSRRWEGTTHDVFALQDAFTADTIRALEIDLVIGEPARIYRASLDGTELWAVYQGWYQFATGTPAAWRRAVELFGSVARARPDVVAGVALTAFALWWGGVQGLSDDPEADLEQAAAFARRGIELGDQTGLSHTVIAALQLHAGGDLDTALADAEEAILRRPTCDVSFAVAGSVHRYLGAWEPAVTACRRAIELSPVPKAWFMTVLASAYYVGEQYHDAIDLAEQVVNRSMGSRDPEALLVLAASQQALGLTRRARATVQTISERFPKLRRGDLSRRYPFRDPAILDRWHAHLLAAGVS
jgi:adenylate cyclase